MISLSSCLFKTRAQLFLAGRFLLNVGLCSTPNSCADDLLERSTASAYSASVISRLEGLVWRSTPNVRRISGVCCRFGGFGKHLREIFLRHLLSFSSFLTTFAGKFYGVCAPKLARQITHAATYASHRAKPPANACRAHKSHRASCATQSQASSSTPQS